LRRACPWRRSTNSPTQISEEIFDIVNERDEVVGRATRAEAHARGLRHRAVHVLVFDASGRIFLQKRSMTKDASPGLWDSSCSGHVVSGEGYDEAAVRELAEEIGISGGPAPARWFWLPAGEATGQEFTLVYRTSHDGDLTLDANEIERGEWLRPEEVERRLAASPEQFCTAFALIWRTAVQRGIKA
jgi:isopentenyl-diphosphate Delta-isomerase